MPNFQLAYDEPWRRMLALLGTGPGRSGIDLDSRELRVRLGWAFTTVIPRSSIRDARRVSDAEGRARFGSIGAHRLDVGSFCVNAAFRNWVFLEIDPPAGGRCVVRVVVHELYLTVENPDAFLAALRET